MMNLWNGIGVDDWLGSYNGVNPLYAHYDWVRYTKNNVQKRISASGNPF